MAMRFKTLRLVHNRGKE